MTAASAAPSFKTITFSELRAEAATEPSGWLIKDVLLSDNYFSPPHCLA